MQFTSNNAAVCTTPELLADLLGRRLFEDDLCICSPDMQQGSCCKAGRQEPHMMLLPLACMSREDGSCAVPQAVMLASCQTCNQIASQPLSTVQGCAWLPDRYTCLLGGRSRLGTAWKVG